jgi:hypothetical protein
MSYSHHVGSWSGVHERSVLHPPMSGVLKIRCASCLLRHRGMHGREQLRGSLPACPCLGIARNEYTTARYQSTVYTVGPYTTCLEVGGTGWRPRHVCSLLCLAAALAMTMLEAHVPASSILAYALLGGCALAGYVSGSLHVSLCMPCCAPVRQLDRLHRVFLLQISGQNTTAVHLPHNKRVTVAPAVALHRTSEPTLLSTTTRCLFAQLDHYLATLLPPGLDSRVQFTSHAPSTAGHPNHHRIGAWHTHSLHVPSLRHNLLGGQYAPACTGAAAWAEEPEEEQKSRRPACASGTAGAGPVRNTEQCCQPPAQRAWDRRCAAG